MTCEEFIRQVRYQADPDGQGPWSPQQLKLALRYAMNDLAQQAAMASGPRMLYEFRIDAKKNEKSYRLPDSIRTIKAVAWTDSDPWTFFSAIQFAAQEFAQSPKGIAYSGQVGPYCYWQDHRRIHLTPNPSKSVAKGIAVFAYAAPEVPDDMDVDLNVPYEAERWVTAKAAMLLVPPPHQKALQSIAAQMQMVDKDLNRWLRKHSADVPPGPIRDGLFT